MTKASLFIAFLISIIKGLSAQQVAADSSVTTDYIRNLYDTYRGNELPIYTGIQFYGYSPVIEGIPFFQSAAWQKGMLEYEGVAYQSVFMKYDLVRDEVVITADKNAGISIVPFSPRISRFSFSGSTFVRLGKYSDGSSLPDGFYQQLAQGKVTAYAKKTKLIREVVSVGAISQFFEDKVKYYVLRDGVYHTIKNAGDLWSLLKEYKKEIQQYLASSNLKYRNDPERTIVAAVEFYNQRAK